MREVAVVALVALAFAGCLSDSESLDSDGKLAAEATEYAVEPTWHNTTFDLTMTEGYVSDYVLGLKRACITVSAAEAYDPVTVLRSEFTVTWDETDVGASSLRFVTHGDSEDYSTWTIDGSPSGSPLEYSIDSTLVSYPLTPPLRAQINYCLEAPDGAVIAEQPVQVDASFLLRSDPSIR